MRRLPRGGKRKNYTLYLTTEEKELIKTTARDLDCSESWLIITLVELDKKLEIIKAIDSGKSLYFMGVDEGVPGGDRSVLHEDVAQQEIGHEEDGLNEMPEGDTPSETVRLGRLDQRGDPSPSEEVLLNEFQEAIHKAPRQESKALPGAEAAPTPTPSQSVRPKMYSMQDLVKGQGAAFQSDRSSPLNPNPHAAFSRSNQTLPPNWPDQLHREVTGGVMNASREIKFREGIARELEAKEADGGTGKTKPQEKARRPKQG